MDKSLDHHKSNAEGVKSIVPLSSEILGPGLHDHKICPAFWYSSWFRALAKVIEELKDSDEFVDECERNSVAIQVDLLEGLSIRLQYKRAVSTKIKSVALWKAY